MLTVYSSTFLFFLENLQRELAQQGSGLEQEPTQQEHHLEQGPPQQENGLKEGNGSTTQAIIENNVKRKGRGATRCFFGNTAEGTAMSEIQFNERG